MTVYPVIVHWMSGQPFQMYLFQTLANAQAFAAQLKAGPETSQQLVFIVTAGWALALQ